MKINLMKYVILSILLASSIKGHAEERLIIVNEGMWQTDNGRLTYFEDGEIVSNEWFRDINGTKLGDTPNDIIQVSENLIAIALNWSNVIQFITSEGEAVFATEDIPNNRKLTSDGKYVYATSYGHETVIDGEIKKFEKGYVAKIDISDFKVKEACEVGFEPEGIAIYKGHLFVANTGGYAFQEKHEYESTVSVIDAKTMNVVRTLDTGHINLYGKLSQSGKYLCINSTGDYYSTNTATIIMDCEAVLQNLPEDECFISVDCSATYNTTDLEGNFLILGSSFSYLTGEYKLTYYTINPEEFFESKGRAGIEADLPGELADSFSKMVMPYGIYVNPYTGYIYGTDAGQNTGAGTLYQWSPDGDLIGSYKTYINPAHFLALPPLQSSEEKPGNEVETPSQDREDGNNNSQDNTSSDKDKNDKDADKDDPGQEKPEKPSQDNNSQDSEENNSEKPNENTGDVSNPEIPGEDKEETGNKPPTNETPDDMEVPTPDNPSSDNSDKDNTDNTESSDNPTTLPDNEDSEINKPSKDDIEEGENGFEENENDSNLNDNIGEGDDASNPDYSQSEEEGNNAVESLEYDSNDKAFYFDLNGCRVSQPSPGKIYIYKGKKIIFVNF